MDFYLCYVRVRILYENIPLGFQMENRKNFRLKILQTEPWIYQSIWMILSSATSRCSNISSLWSLQLLMAFSSRLKRSLTFMSFPTVVTLLNPSLALSTAHPVRQRTRRSRLLLETCGHVYRRKDFESFLLTATVMDDGQKQRVIKEIASIEAISHNTIKAIPTVTTPLNVIVEMYCQGLEQHITMLRNLIK